MKFVIGLGNPSFRYRNTRHNVGFMVLDALAQKEKIRFSRSIKFKSLIARKNYNEDEVLFVKPQTFMNLSHLAIERLFSCYHPRLEDMLVVYDDMDLELGRIKFARKGSSAGHKGMDSIIGLLHTEYISRLRIGISKPKDNQRAEKYVLSEFNSEEKKILERVIEKSVAGCIDWIRYGIDYVMQRYNRRGG